MYRRVRSLRRRVLLIGAVLAVVVVIRIGPSLFRPTAPETLAEGSYAVKRVMEDGTLELENGAHVCLIGVSFDSRDEKAAAFIDSLVKGNFNTEVNESASQPGEENARAMVRLEFDRERVDRDGRFHAYAWLSDKLLNEEVLRAGHGRADLQSRYNQSKKTRLRRAEQEAKSAGRGRWATP